MPLPPWMVVMIIMILKKYDPGRFWYTCCHFWHMLLIFHQIIGSWKHPCNVHEVSHNILVILPGGHASMIIYITAHWSSLAVTSDKLDSAKWSGIQIYSMRHTDWSTLSLCNSIQTLSLCWPHAYLRLCGISKIYLGIGYWVVNQGIVWACWLLFAM